jgi:hypothetical protein
MQTQVSLKKEKGQGTPICCSYCDYNWTYHGRFLIYATCPQCHRNTKINQNKVSSLPQSVKVGAAGRLQ